MCDCLTSYFTDNIQRKNRHFQKNPRLEQDKIDPIHSNLTLIFVLNEKSYKQCTLFHSSPKQLINIKKNLLPFTSAVMSRTSKFSHLHTFKIIPNFKTIQPKSLPLVQAIGNQCFTFNIESGTRGPKLSQMIAVLLEKIINMIKTIPLFH